MIRHTLGTQCPSQTPSKLSNTPGLMHQQAFRCYFIFQNPPRKGEKPRGDNEVRGTEVAVIHQGLT